MSRWEVICNYDLMKDRFDIAVRREDPDGGPPFYLNRVEICRVAAGDRPLFFSGTEDGARGLVCAFADFARDIGWQKNESQTSNRSFEITVPEFTLRALSPASVMEKLSQACVHYASLRGVKIDPDPHNRSASFRWTYDPEVRVYRAWFEKGG